MSPSPERRFPRIQLFVQVELTNLRTKAPLRAWTGNVSRGGCYVRTPNPFAMWTPVFVRLAKGAQWFEAKGSVAHAKPGEGMGIALEEVAPDQQAILDAWLAES